MPSPCVSLQAFGFHTRARASGLGCGEAGHREPFVQDQTEMLGKLPGQEGR